MMYPRMSPTRRRYVLKDMATGQPINTRQWVSHPYGGAYRVLHVTRPVFGSPKALVERRGGPRPGTKPVCIRVDNLGRCLTVLVTE